MSLVRELEKIELEEKIKRLKESSQILHVAGGLTETLVYEPISLNKYVYKTIDGKKGFATLKVECEDEERKKKPHWFIEIEGERYYFNCGPPKRFLFEMPKLEEVENWVKGEKQSLTTDRIWRLNGVYLRTFLDFPREFEFAVAQLFILQSWLTEMLPVVFYLGIKGEFGGEKPLQAKP